MTALIEVENLAVAGREGIVNPTSLRVMAGVPFTILGETGSGKSLLAQAIAGTLPDGLSATGSVRINGRDVLGLSRDERRRGLWGRELAILPQEPWLALDPTARTAAQVEEGYARIRQLPLAAARQAARDALRSVGLGQTAGKFPGQLSGGMAQRAAFVAARAGGAPIVIADEPTKGLDAARRDDAVDLLKHAMGDAGGLLVISHDMAVPRRLGGEVAVMLRGEIIEAGPAERVLSAPRHDYTRRLLSADPASWATPEGSPHGDAVIEISGLAKGRGGRKLFADLSFTLHRGEIIGIVGPSGCGKSTLGDLLLGLLPPDVGRIRLDPRFPRVRFQKIWQDPPAAFPPHLPLRRLLDDLARLHGIGPGRAEALMDRLHLSPHLLDRRPGEISGGELQRFSLLRALLLDPVFLFADEPTSRLDLITQQEIVELLRRFARETPCGLLIVSHDLDLIARIADRVIEVGGLQATD
ncbi:MAG: ABC transporter ATP-binding protein [Ferrovibrionaceae bacterium]